MWQFCGILVNWLSLCFRHPDRILLSNGIAPSETLSASYKEYRLWLLKHQRFVCSVIIFDACFCSQSQHSFPEWFSEYMLKNSTALIFWVLFCSISHSVIVSAGLRESQTILIRKLNQLFEFTNVLLGSFLWRFHYIPNNKRLKSEILIFACTKMPFFHKSYGFCANYRF